MQDWPELGNWSVDCVSDGRRQTPAGRYTNDDGIDDMSNDHVIAGDTISNVTDDTLNGNFTADDTNNGVTIDISSYYCTANDKQICNLSLHCRRHTL